MLRLKITQPFLYFDVFKFKNYNQIYNKKLNLL